MEQEQIAESQEVETTPAVETDAVAAAPAEEVKAEEAQVETETKEEQPRDDRGRFQKRVDDLTKARGEAEREAAYWKAQALGKDQSSSVKSDAPAPKPTAENYSNYEDFVEALTSWKAEELIKADKAKTAQEQKTQAAMTSWQQRETDFKSKTPDYTDVVGNSDVSLPQHVLEGIQESDLGPQLAYHFAKNPEAADKFRTMSPGAALRELGRLEASISSAATPAPAPAARTTNAPPPVKALSQASAGVPTLDKMSMEEYIKARKTQGASWSR